MLPAETIALLVALLLFISGAIHELKQRHSPEIYTIWYIFSFFLLLFFALYYFAEKEGTEVTHVLGPSYTETLTLVHHTLTDVRGELLLVAAVVYLAIIPQLLTYLLSGLSGSATPPLFVQQTATIAVWSVIKFLAGLSGILLAHPLAKLSLGTQISASDFTQGLGALCFAFMTAAAYYQFFEHDFGLPFGPGLRIHVRAPILLEVHKYFTRHRRPAKPFVPEVATSAERKDELKLEHPWLTVRLRGDLVREARSMFEAKQNRDRAAALIRFLVRIWIEPKK